MAAADDPGDKRYFTAMWDFSVEQAASADHARARTYKVVSMRINSQDASWEPGTSYREQGHLAFDLSQAADRAAREFASIRRRLQERDDTQDAAATGGLIADMSLLLLSMGQFDEAAFAALNLLDYGRSDQSFIGAWSLGSLEERFPPLADVLDLARSFFAPSGHESLGNWVERRRVAARFRELGRWLENGHQLGKFADRIAK